MKSPSFVVYLTWFVILLFLSACSGSAPTGLVPGERVEIHLGLTGVSMDAHVETSGFYTLFTEGNEDTVCKISDSTGRTVVEDDDSGADYNCLLNAALEAGRYKIEIRGYEVSDRGRAEVVFEQLPTQTVSAGEVANVSLQHLLGSVVQLDIGTAGFYRLGTTGMVDTQCWIHDSEGVELAYNDDFGNDQNCGMIERLNPGRHHVLIRGYEGSSGNAAFMASQMQVRTVRLAVDVPAAEQLQHAEDLVDFQVDVTEPGMYVFSTTGDTDTYCELRSSSGELLAHNDDADDHNCRVQHAINAGRYHFTVKGYDGTTGDFVAQVNRR
jgi:hypothetical protein